MHCNDQTADISNLVDTLHGIRIEKIVVTMSYKCRNILFIITYKLPNNDYSHHNANSSKRLSHRSNKLIFLLINKNTIYLLATETQALII